MSLNIKDPETHELAAELARETGETMTRAVMIALRERLARVKRDQKPKITAAELLAIGHRCAATLKRAPIDHAVLLYDDQGLPK
jgi:antitoxin VapB